MLQHHYSKLPACSRLVHLSELGHTPLLTIPITVVPSSPLLELTLSSIVPFLQRKLSFFKCNAGVLLLHVKSSLSLKITFCLAKLVYITIWKKDL